MNNMGIIINNPKSGGGKDYLGLRIEQTQNYTYKNDVATKIPAYLFYLDKKITSVSFTSATEISSHVFDSCENLLSINFPLVTKIGVDSFIGCGNLKSIDFPSLTQLDTGSFQGCSSLTKVNLPLITSISRGAFSNCSALTDVIFPLVTNISREAFYGCSALTSITLGSSTLCSLSNTDAIPATSSHHITIYVPADLISNYQTATNWVTLYNNNYITFSPITDGSTHTVSVSSFSEGGNCNTYYSLDNGSIWTEITGTGTLSTTATQIKFRCVSVGGAPETCTISSATLLLDFSQSLMSSGTYETSNYTLTSDVTDIVIDEAEIVLPD